LHIDSQNQSTNDKGSATNWPAAETRGSSTAEDNIYCSFNSKTRNHILQATAFVEIQKDTVQYVSSRALLDSASQ